MFLLFLWFMTRVVNLGLGLLITVPVVLWLPTLVLQMLGLLLTPVLVILGLFITDLRTFLGGVLAFELVGTALLILGLLTPVLVRLMFLFTKGLDFGV